MWNNTKCDLLGEFLQDRPAKRSRNYNSCKLLDRKLGTIYNDLSETREGYKTDTSLRSNLDFSNFNLYYKSLPCSKKNTFYCNQSENSSDSELKQFLYAYFKEVKTQIETPALYEKSKKDENMSFRTAKEEFESQLAKSKTVKDYRLETKNSDCGISVKRKLGNIRRNINSKFVSPLQSTSNEDIVNNTSDDNKNGYLKNIDPKMIELIQSEIMDVSSNISWSDIAGLEYAKSTIQEIIVWPLLRPDIFKGLRRPPKGILLFGPPGTGKTLIGKCVACQSKATFFSISASSLTSKWIGDSEKMVRALFSVARAHQPSIIFIDEVDSLLSKRNETEHESSRRTKTEFLVQLDGATTENEERIVVIGATNRPQELDDAARRRFVKRLYIPLPDYESRLQLLKKLLANENHKLNEQDFQSIAQRSDGYSGADVRNLCAEASLCPIRSIDKRCIEQIQTNEVRPLAKEDFDRSFETVRPSVCQDDLEQYNVWNNTFGAGKK